MTNRDLLKILKATPILVVALLVFLTSACGVEPAAPMAATATPASSTTAEPSDQKSQGTAGEVAAAVAARTPEPTPTPGALERRIDQFTTSRGLFDVTFLGLTTDEWISLAVSILIIFAGYLVGVRLAIGALKWGARRTPTKVDDAFVDYTEAEWQWLVAIFFVRWAIERLDVRSDQLRLALDDLIFTAILLVVTLIALKAIRFAANHYREMISSQNTQGQFSTVVLAAQRVGEFMVLVVALAIGMSHFGISANVLTVVIVIAGAVLGFGARDLIADAIGGFIILSDQPFRVGDAILLSEPDIWGDVLLIGARTTRIRMRDNRVVIVPNSQISKREIVNYSYPDRSYRLQSDVRIPYDADLSLARAVIGEAVRQIPEVLPDQPVEVLFLEFGESARLIRVRWWVPNYQDKYPMLDRVNEAIEKALQEAGIQIAYSRYELDLRQDQHLPSGM